MDKIQIASDDRNRWNSFLRIQTRLQELKSRRKLNQNKYGSEKKGGRTVWLGDKPDYQTDHDEVGSYA